MINFVSYIFTTYKDIIMLLNLTLAVVLPIITLSPILSSVPIRVVAETNSTHVYTKQEQEKIAEEMKPVFDAITEKVDDELAKHGSISLSLKDAKYDKEFSIEFKVLIVALVTYYKHKGATVSCIRVAEDTLTLDISILQNNPSKLVI